MSNFEKLNKMYEKWGFGTESKDPQPLTKEEHIFRIQGMFEELMEYISAVFDIEPDSPYFPGSKDEIKHSVNEIGEDLDKLPLKKSTPEVLEEQADALGDLMVFAMGNMFRQNFPCDEIINEILNANSVKTPGAIEGKRGNSTFDLKKPDWFSPPQIGRLLERVKHRNKPTGIIVLEGPDGAGKTTVAKALQEKYGAAVIHKTWSEELQKRMPSYLLEEIIDFDTTSGLLVIDRSYISEFIYSEVFRDGTEWPLLKEKAESLLMEKNAVVVFCSPASTVNDYKYEMQKLIYNREEMYDDVEKLGEVFSAFRSQFYKYCKIDKCSRPKVMLYNFRASENAWGEFEPQLIDELFRKIGEKL